MDLLATPHIFSQYRPLTTRDFIKHAKRYRLQIDTAALQRLHERGELSPLAVITDEPVRAPMPAIDDPVVVDTLWSTFRRAQLDGRILDPTDPASPKQDSGGQPLVEFRERQVGDSANWWNGLLYSRWQLLNADWIRARARPGVTLDQEPPEIREMNRLRAAEQRRLALTITVLEAPYLPRIRPDLVHLRNFDVDEWYQWVADYDPHASLAHLGLHPDDLPRLAEVALSRARSLDPSGAWHTLIGRASAQAWEKLEGDLAAAIDLRVAAEILLLFNEALDHKDPTPVESGALHISHPLDDRLSARAEPLDRVLSRLGVSPHPGVMLLIEGESERRHVRLILEHLYAVDTAHLIRVVPMDGANRGLDLLAVATAAPLLSDRRHGHYEMIRPPCQVIVAVDPDKGWRTEAQAEAKRRRLVDALRRAVEAQAEDADTRELDLLVDIVRWEASCYEFAHFTDAELLSAITAVHDRPLARPNDSDILDRLAKARARNLDIKHVWHDWDYEPPKPDLADALWPFLRDRMEAAKASQTEQPHVVATVLSAFDTAVSFSQGTWSLPVRPTTD